MNHLHKFDDVWISKKSRGIKFQRYGSVDFFPLSPTPTQTDNDELYSVVPFVKNKSDFNLKIN